MDPQPAASRDPRRPLLLAAIALLVAAGVLFLFGSVATSWVALAGTVLLLLYFIVRRAALAPPPDDRDSMMFGQSTTMEEMPSRSDDAKPPA